MSGLSSCYDPLEFLIKETIPQTINSKTPNTITAFIIEKLAKAISPSLSNY
ncbi:hypothetical protein J5TS1_22370 [Bacillus licheniformis]|nr:hypothetical protein BLHB2_24880 [Bacillus licheniformis]GIN23506.1 hypothetical protein J31TS2_00860 [Bacillus licheniformis]GIN28047.1 hypothetical protein J2TS5_00860 [Bacillus licheniformis]GIN34734.1 hypothetical protein J5TS1_22370 [Bacillus licheniformis]